MGLREAWEANAGAWIRWAREPGHDSYWRFHREAFFALLPPPGNLTVDVGCGEGRVSRDLHALGHRIIGIDASPTMIAAARSEDREGEYLLADATALPLEDGCADLAVAFMSLQDVDEMPAAVGEIARILSAGGRVCLAIEHPLNSAGKFTGEQADSPFVITGSYLDEFAHTAELERDGLRMTFNSRHRPLEAYGRALEAAGLLIEAIREPATPDDALRFERWRRWQRVPLFLHLRALKA
jgi:SAM-dependent methyltransferase